MRSNDIKRDDGWVVRAMRQHHEDRRTAARAEVRRPAGSGLSGLGTAVAVLGLGLLNAGIGGLLLNRLQPAPAGTGPIDRARPGTDVLGAVASGNAPLEVAVGAAVSAVGIAITGWWILCLVVTTGAELRRRRSGRAPGTPSLLTPVFMRRLVGALLSAHLMAGTTAGAAAAAVPTTPVVAAAPVATASGFPTAAVPATLLSTEAHAAAVVPASDPAPGADPWFVPRAPALEDGAPLVRPPSRQDAAPARTATVVAGDTLWTLAARQLGPLATDLQIARLWPRWHALNRDLIGADPGMIRPGQVLRVPAVAGGPEGADR